MIHLDENKEMRKLDNLLSNKIKNKNQCDDTKEYDMIFDNKFTLFSGPNMEPLTVVNVSLRGGNKHRATIIDVLTYIRDSGSTEITIKGDTLNLTSARYNPTRWSTVQPQDCIVRHTASRCHFVGQNYP